MLIIQLSWPNKGDELLSHQILCSADCIEQGTAPMTIFGQLRLILRLLFVGRAFLKQGIYWSMELDGRQVMVLLFMHVRILGYLDRGFHPLSRLSNRCSQVSEFIFEDHGWVKLILEEHFEQSDVKVILIIPFRRQVLLDKLIWHYDAKGRFSTKSAYQLASQLVYPNQSSSNANETNKLWFSGLPGKIKVHIWRVCSSILPTISMLRLKKVFLKAGYYFCNAEYESIKHISRDCCFIRDFIKLFPELREIFRTIYSATYVYNGLVDYLL